MFRSKVQDELSGDEYEEDEAQPLNPGTTSHSRAGNNDWCICGCCGRMETEAECVCCQEQPAVLLRVMECNQQAECVVQHPFFASVCLNPYALQALYTRDKRIFGSMFNTPLYKKYQITAFRAFVEHFHNSLRGSITVPLPACVLTTIRNSFNEQMAIDSFPGYCQL